MCIDEHSSQCVEATELIDLEEAFCNTSASLIYLVEGGVGNIPSKSRCSGENELMIDVHVNAVYPDKLLVATQTKSPVKANWTANV